jgi:hypothetical protein
MYRCGWTIVIELARPGTLDLYCGIDGEPSFPVAISRERVTDHWLLVLKKRMRGLLRLHTLATFWHAITELARLLLPFVKGLVVPLTIVALLDAWLSYAEQPLVAQLDPVTVEQVALAKPVVSVWRVWQVEEAVSD